MSYTIAVAGKGGTGKTTIAALLVRVIKEDKLGSALAVDADPNSNLGEVLGLLPQENIGAIVDDVAAHPESIPAGMPKERFIEYRVQTSIQEADGFDLLTMGRPEGPGCYCFVNNILRNIIAGLSGDYDYIIIDNEAGLEHLSRRTTRMVDLLLLVSDATKVGLASSARINALVDELKIKVKARFLIINRNSAEVDKGFGEKLGVEYIFSLPQDEKIANFSLSGTSLMELDKDAVGLRALHKIGEKIWQAK